MFRNIPEKNLQAAKKYFPKVFPGRMTIFLSGDVPKGSPLDPEKDLEGMQARETVLRIVPGDRDSMLREPFVAELAEQLNACLRDATPPTGP